MQPNRPLTQISTSNPDLTSATDLDPVFAPCGRFGAMPIGRVAPVGTVLRSGTMERGS